ncbi:MAG TPA: DUF4398 domain-containing protein, partial [Candidatus Binatia bacterium]
FLPWVITSLIILYAFENSGCSTGKPPTETFSKAELGLRAASEARAEELASVELRSAREKLERSKQALAAKKYEEARRLAESAEVDAELAEAKAEAEITRRAAEALRKSIDVPRTEAERGSRKSLSTESDKE